MTSKYIVLLVLLFTIYLPAISQETERVSLIDNEIIEVDLIHHKQADISKNDWIKLRLRNKSSQSIFIKSFNYSINTFITDEAGNEKLNRGAIGQSKMYNLIKDYHNIKKIPNDRKVFKLDSKKEIIAYQYPTNTASAILDLQIRNIEEVCALMEVEVEYGLQNDLYDDAYAEEAFCFDWHSSATIDPLKIAHNLESKIAQTNGRKINSAIINVMVLNEATVANLTIDTIIYGIKERAYNDNKSERLALLKALNKKNGFNTPRIIDHYISCMQDKSCNWIDDLKYYWSNELFDTLIANRLFINEKVKILENHSEAWRNDEKKRDKFYNHLVSKIDIDFNQTINQETFQKWYNKTKLLASTRHPEVITYFESLLDNETFYAIEDWSGQMKKKVFTTNDKPKVIKIRVCDVAYVGLLRALNKVELNKTFDGFRYSQSIFIDDIWRGSDDTVKGVAKLKDAYSVLPTNLRMAEKFYYLNEELKIRIRKSIRRLGY